VPSVQHGVHRSLDAGSASPLYQANADASAALCARLFICFGRASRGRLGISIHLSDCVTQSDQIATRRFGSSTGRVSGKFCLIQL